ncbi:MAG: hypothetical protein Q8L66_02330 [Caulobacter sp.]|nr:hypothetical protein [Caulobacter sp.]
MRTLLMATVSAALLMATPALAQDPHHPAAPAATPALDAALTDAEMHDMCKAIMGDQMAPRAVHDHGRDKTGAATWPGGKPLSKAEMEGMHKKCAAMMAPADASTAATPTPQ